MWDHRFRRVRASGAAAFLSVAPFLMVGSVCAQQAPTDCTYSRCALGIVPAWNGLVVTKGAGQQRVGNLGFFWTSSLAPLFAGNDSAAVYARRAVRVRRAAAALTDVGGAAMGYVALRAALRGRLQDQDRVVGVVGASLFVESVPLQFGADGLLSHAIWWRNSDYSGR